LGKRNNDDGKRTIGASPWYRVITLTDVRNVNRHIEMFGCGRKVVDMVVHHTDIFGEKP
jgi:hypothetical protein